MKIWSIEGNRQRLDGGAMFGNVPQALWRRWYRADSNNRIELACRALLLQEDDGRLILFETGIGAFFDPTMKARFGVEEQEHVLLANLARAGFRPDQVDVVVLSHLHFDHAGGLLSSWSEDEPLRLVFPKATIMVSDDSWERAQNPHDRDRASFIPELNELLASSGRLEIVSGRESPTLGPNFRFHYSEGHTPGLMLTEVTTSLGPIVFAGDLIPGSAWVHLPITMGYDRFPERLIDEKRDLLSQLQARRGLLFFTHDPDVAIGRVDFDEKARYSVNEVITSQELWARDV